MALSDVVPCDFCDEALNLTFCNDCFVRLCNECKTKHSGISLCKNLVPYKERKLNCTRVCNVHRKDESNILCKTCTLPICSSCLGRHKDHALIVRNELSTRRGKCLETLQYQFEEMKLMEKSSNFTFELCGDSAQEIEKTLKDLLKNDDQDNPVFAFELAGRNETEYLRRENAQLSKENERLTKEMKATQSTVQRLEKERKECEDCVQKMTNEIKRQAVEIKDLARAYEAQRTDNYNLNIHINQMKRSLEEQRRTMDKLQKKLSEEKKAKENALKRLTKEMEATQSTVQRLEKERKELKDHIQKMTNEIERQAVEIKDFARAYETQTTDIYNLNIQISQMSRSLEEQRRTIDKLQKNLSEEKKAKENALKSKEETTDVLQKANAELIREKDSLHRKMAQEISKKSEMFVEYESALKNLNLQANQMNRGLDEQKKIIDELQKKISEEKKAKEIGLNSNQTLGKSDFDDPYRPLKVTEKSSELCDNEWTYAMEKLESELNSQEENGIKLLLRIFKNRPNRPNHSLKLAERVTELYDNEWTNAMENLECDLNIPEEKGIGILLKVIKNVFDTCAEFGDDHLQSFPDMLILPPSFIKEDKERMLNVKDLPPEMLKPMKDFRKSHAKHAITHLQKFLSTDEGISKLQIKKKVVKPCEEYINKCIELCWMMRIQDPPIYMETGYPTNSEFDSSKMRSYTKAGKFIHFVVWPTFFLHKDGPLLAKGVVQGSKTEIKDGKEINGDDECNSSNSETDGEEYDDARSLIEYEN